MQEIINLAFWQDHPSYLNVISKMWNPGKHNIKICVYCFINLTQKCKEIIQDVAVELGGKCSWRIRCKTTCKVDKLKITRFTIQALKIEEILMVERHRRHLLCGRQVPRQKMRQP